MTELITTYCDVCNPNQQNAYASRGRGVAEMPFEMAKELGWQERDGGHICVECLEAEGGQDDD